MEKKDGTIPSNKGEDEDARKTKTAKFIAELLKRSLEAKLDLASKESEYEKLQEELEIMKTRCANERTLRLAAEKENADLEKNCRWCLQRIKSIQEDNCKSTGNELDDDDYILLLLIIILHSITTHIIIIIINNNIYLILS